VRRPPGRGAFIEFLASHDGIGVRPAEGLLDDREIGALADTAVRHGGRVSFFDTPDGAIPYELNVTLFDALSNPSAREPERLRVARFVAAHAIMLALSGVPWIYLPSLIGAGNDTAMMEATGIARRINRRRFELAELEAALGDRRTRAARVFAGMAALLRARATHPAFRPDSPQEILDLPDGVVGIRRGSAATGRVTCLVNVTASAITIRVERGAGSDVFSGSPPSRGALTLDPYRVAWLSDGT